MKRVLLIVSGVLLLIFSLAAFDGRGGGYLGYAGAWGWGWIIMRLLGGALLLTLMVLALVVLIKKLKRGEVRLSGALVEKDSALETLKIRFANGEISSDEYKSMRETLTE